MTTPLEKIRATRTTATGTEARFPHTLDSVKHFEVLKAELKRRRQPCSNAAVYRYALAVAAAAVKP